MIVRIRGAGQKFQRQLQLAVERQSKAPTLQRPACFPPVKGTQLRLISTDGTGANNPKDDKKMAQTATVRPTYSSQVKSGDFVPLSQPSMDEPIPEEDLPRLLGSINPNLYPTARASNPVYVKKKWEKKDVDQSLDPQWYISNHDPQGKYLNRPKRREYRPKPRQAKPGRPRRKPPKVSVAEILRQRKEVYVPRNEWAVITHIPPVSTLKTMVEGINEALDRALLDQGSFLDLEATWHPSMATGEIPLPVLDATQLFPQYSTSSTTDTQKAQDDLFRWVHEARLLLSPMGRPTGWKIRFANRSIAFALLTSTTQENPLKYAWKVVGLAALDRQTERQLLRLLPLQDALVRVSFQKQQQQGTTTTTVEPIGKNYLYYDDLDCQNLDWLDDSVVRVENCDEKTDEQDLLHVFSRFDLKAPSILRWIARTSDGKQAPPTFLVRFADASWARAAMREKQGTKVGMSELRMVQYPKQYIPVPTASTQMHEKREEAEESAA